MELKQVLKLEHNFSVIENQKYALNVERTEVRYKKTQEAVTHW